MILAVGILLYIFLIFLLPRLIVPNYGFIQSKVPQHIPEYFVKVIADIKSTSGTKEEFLRSAYDYITKTYTGGRFRTILYLRYVFDDPFSHKKGFIQCSVQNFLLRVMLVKSSMFEEKDVRTQTVFLNFFTHQYLKVKIHGKWIPIDPHTHSLGVPFGKRAIFFV